MFSPCASPSPKTPIRKSTSAANRPREHLLSRSMPSEVCNTSKRNSPPNSARPSRSRSPSDAPPPKPPGREAEAATPTPPIAAAAKGAGDAHRQAWAPSPVPTPESSRPPSALGTKPDGTSKCFALVTYKRKADAETALAVREMRVAARERALEAKLNNTVAGHMDNMVAAQGDKREKLDALRREVAVAEDEERKAKAASAQAAAVAAKQRVRAEEAQHATMPTRSCTAADHEARGWMAVREQHEQHSNSIIRLSHAAAEHHHDDARRRRVRGRVGRRRGVAGHLPDTRVGATVGVVASVGVVVVQLGLKL